VTHEAPDDQWLVSIAASGVLLYPATPTLPGSAPFEIVEDR
jgi:hypothetical protein